MRGLMQDSPLDVGLIMRRAEDPFGHKRVIGDVETTWAALVARARRLAAALDALDVPRNARVGTFGWNTRRHTELYLGVPVAGRVLHTVNHRLFADEIVYIVNHAADDVLFVDRTLLAKVWPLIDRFLTVRRVVVMDDGGDAVIPDDTRVLDYEAILPATGGDLPAVDENDAASLCYTSGTTGRPKGVLYSHRSIVLHALMLLGADAFAIGERDVVLPIVPMFHVNAWGLPYAAMLAGSDLVLPGPAPTPSTLIGLIERHRVTFSAAVTTVWRGLLPLLGGADVSSLRMVVSGGGPLPDSLSRAWEEATGRPITSSWGMTETSPAVTAGRLSSVHEGLGRDERRRVLGKPGVPLPLTEVRIGDDGEVQVHGPTVAADYFGVSSPSSFTADGWLRTGDIGTRDAYGYLEIVDRAKDLVKSGGEWISSATLENEIMAHPAVLEAAVIAIPDDYWGERPLACVVRAPGAQVGEAELRTHLTPRVASWWIPDRFVFLDEIPKTGTGKFSKVALRTLLRE